MITNKRRDNFWYSFGIVSLLLNYTNLKFDIQWQARKNGFGDIVNPGYLKVLTYSPYSDMSDVCMHSFPVILFVCIWEHYFDRD